MKIGIFWYFQNQIIGIEHNFNQSDQIFLGLIDITYNDVEYWKTLKHTFPNLQEFEYENVAPIKVIYNVKKKLCLYEH